MGWPRFASRKRVSRWKDAAFRGANGDYPANAIIHGWELHMTTSLASIVLCTVLTQATKPAEYEAGYLCQPAYAIDDAVRGPIKKYVPQPGDIYLSTDRSLIINAGHRIAWSGQPNHSGRSEEHTSELQ